MARIMMFVALAALLSVSVADAQPVTKFETWIVSEISRWTARVDGWQLSGHLSLGITLAIGVFGIIVTALQPLQSHRRWKCVIGTLGVLVASLTLLKTQIYDVDHRTYYRAADDGRDVLDRIDGWVQLTYTDEEERRGMIEQVRALLNELERLRLSVRERTGSAPQLTEARQWPSLLPVALAQTRSAKPGWLNGRPADGDRVYFVGVGIDASLATAKSAAFANAITAARDDLTGRLPAEKGYDTAALSSYLAEGATTVDSYFERDPRGYRYYTLVALSKRQIETDARLFGFREKVQVSTDTVRAAQTVQPSSVEYQLKRQDTYSKLTVDAQRRVDPAVYRLYEAGRTARLKRDTASAIPLLEQVVRQAPEFFMAWYNLALAREEARDGAGAEAAYKRAVALEPKQAVRDASVYNSFGAFLYNSGRVAESRQWFAKALEIEPSHAIARRNLALTGR